MPVDQHLYYANGLFGVSARLAAAIFDLVHVLYYYHEAIWSFTWLPANNSSCNRLLQRLEMIETTAIFFIIIEPY